MGSRDGASRPPHELLAPAIKPLQRAAGHRIECPRFEPAPSYLRVGSRHVAAEIRCAAPAECHLCMRYAQRGPYRWLSVGLLTDPSVAIARSAPLVA